MILVKNGVIVTPTSSFLGDILIREGKIAAVQPQIETPDAEVYDAAGCRIFPGFIDAHTHFDLEVGGVVTADDFQTGTRAALAGGTTTIIDFATQAKGGSLTQALAQWQEKAAGVSACDYGFHLAITHWCRDTQQELPAMMAAGVSSFKVYLAYEELRLRDHEVYQILATVDKLGGIVSAHCENGDLIGAFIRENLSLGKKEPRYHPLSRPPITEAEAVSRFTYLAQLAGAAVNIVHLSSALGLEAALRARQRGAQAYIESCPQYFLLEDSCYDQPDFAGAKYVCSPPLRGKADLAALWRALACGHIDYIATDHCSFNFRGQKELGRGDFSKIPNGLPGVEQRPVLMYTRGVVPGRISENRFVAALSENPARLFGLYPRKGTLAPGSDADLVVWDPKQRQTIAAETQFQRVDYTPYEGIITLGRPRAVFLRGELLVENGEVLRENAGQYLSRQPSAYYRI